MDQMENLFMEINKNLKKYQDDLLTVEEKYKKHHKYFDRTKLQLNRIRLARTPAYSNQPQVCSTCNKPYVYLKWYKYCDRKQFQQQFANWKIGSSVIDNFIHESQLSIKYPNGY